MRKSRRGALEAVWPPGADKGDISSFQKAGLDITETCHDFPLTAAWQLDVSHCSRKSGCYDRFRASLWKIIRFYYIFTMSGLEGLFCFWSRVHHLHISADNINIAESLYETVWSKNLQLCFSFLFQAGWSKKTQHIMWLAVRGGWHWFYISVFLQCRVAMLVSHYTTFLSVEVVAESDQAITES